MLITPFYISPKQGQLPYLIVIKNDTKLTVKLYEDSGVRMLRSSFEVDEIPFFKSICKAVNSLVKLIQKQFHLQAIEDIYEILWINHKDDKNKSKKNNKLSFSDSLFAIHNKRKRILQYCNIRTNPDKSLF